MKYRIKQTVLNILKKYMKNTISLSTTDKAAAMGLKHHCVDSVKKHTGTVKPHISKTAENQKVADNNNQADIDLSSLDQVEEVQCSGHDHYSYESLNQVFNLPVDTLFQYVFTECDFSQKFNTARRAPDCKLTPWPEETESDGNKIRHVNYDVTVTYSLGTKTSKSSEKQTLYSQSKPGHIYVVDTEVTNSGIPYTETFYVANRYCITRVSNTQTRLRVTSEIKYKKHVWGVIKNFIEKNTYSALTEVYKLLADLLVQEEPQRLVGGTSIRKSKVIRRRRTRNATEMKKPETVETEPVTSVENPTPLFSKSTADDLVKVIYVILILLVIFNGVLFYKLWSLEYRAKDLRQYQDQAFPDMSKVPTTDAGWVKLLEGQHKRHGSEILKWKSVISTTVSLVKQIESTLEELDRSIESRNDDYLENINFAAEKLAMDQKKLQEETKMFT